VDALQMPPNAPANVGKANIRSWAESFLSAFRTKFTLSVAELQVVTDRAFESGAYSITLTPDGDSRSIEDIGKHGLPKASHWWLGRGPKHLEQRPTPTHDRLAHAHGDGAASNGPATASKPEKDLSLEEQERPLLVSALERAGGNQSQAARILRISRDRMRYKMSKHNLK
jgi:DNA-binding NtrC family response regulator